jgi:hypothetical protein
MLIVALFNNLFYSYVQVFVGRAFDLITTPDWKTSSLLWLAVGAAGVALGQGLTGLARNYFGEFLAQRIERDTRD